MKNPFLLFASIFLITVSVNAQKVIPENVSDCLSPIGQPLFGGLKQYEELIDEMIFSKFSNLQTVRYQKSEFVWAIELEDPQEDPKYIIRVVYPETSIWSSIPHTDGIKINNETKKIEAHDARLIAKLFRAALSTVCAKCHNIGMGEMMFYFSDISTAGRVWLAKSGQEGLREERLVSICEDISKELLRGKGSRIRLTPEMRDSIRQLTLDFEEKKE
ncbi:hypothetical protein [Ekhidna sp.]|uniref:hypothetical protein n=1 Tax=Ekhidna sp. TaxID=2608089 RepID=UPI0032969C32